MIYLIINATAPFFSQKGGIDERNRQQTDRTKDQE